MIIEDVQLPSGHTVRLAYFEKGNPTKSGCELRYLHLKRSVAAHLDPAVLQVFERSYLRVLPKIEKAFEVFGGQESFEAVVRAPSRSADAEPYLNAFKKACGECLDLTKQFKKAAEFQAGAATTWQEVHNSIEYCPVGGLSQITRLVIIDDVFADGKTAAAIVERLKASGLTSACEITVAVGLWVVVSR